MTKIDKAVDRYKGEYNCAQAVITTYSEELGLKEDIAMSLTAAFGAGINYRGEMCGAVSAALLLIGLKSKKLDGLDELKKEMVKEYCDKFIQEFKEQNNGVLCKKLLNADLSVAEELEKARKNDIFSGICPGLVRSSAVILEKLFTEMDNIFMKL